MSPAALAVALASLPLPPGPPAPPTAPLEPPVPAVPFAPFCVTFAARQITIERPSETMMAAHRRNSLEKYGIDRTAKRHITQPPVGLPSAAAYTRGVQNGNEITLAGQK